MSEEEEFNGIRCDMCSNEYLYEDGVIVTGIYALPEGWFMLQQGRYRRGQPKIHAKFSPICCSKACLSAWLQKEEV